MKKILLLGLVLATLLAAGCDFPVNTAPEASVQGGVVAKNSEVSLSTYLSNAEIRYTIDGSNPTIGSTLYSSPITIAKNTVVKAVVVRNGEIVSGIMTEEYLVRAEKPSADKVAGTYSASVDVTLSCETDSVSYYYTTDGTTPTQSSPVCTGSLTISKNTTLKVVAANSDFHDSEVLTVAYKIRTAAPTADLANGTYGTAKSVTLSCDSADTSIYYTLDGTAPTTASSKYTSAVNISSATPARISLKLLAVAEGCEPAYVVTYDYLFYSLGPAGGVVFYDCDADNDGTNNGAGPDGLKSTDCGWRYLEAAPSDIGSSTNYIFGYYRTSKDGEDLYSNGATTYTEGTFSATDGNCTGTKVGTGEANTAKLVAAMGEAAYSLWSGYSEPGTPETTSDYAAKLCDDYECAGFGDWFLPSKDEILLMQRRIYLNGLGSFAQGCYYWSSSETDYSIDTVWVTYINNGSQSQYFTRSNKDRIRAIRAY